MDTLDFLNTLTPAQAPGAAVPVGLQDQQSSMSGYEAQLLSAALAVCHAKLGLKATSTGLQSQRLHGAHEGSAAEAADTAFLHLAAALGSSNASSMSSDARAADAAAVGHALAFLLHPASAAGRMPSALLEEAWQVLASRGKSVANPGPVATASIGGGMDGKSVSRVWEARAKGSKALTQLLELTGMDPVKKQLFSLADQVGHLLSAALSRLCWGYSCCHPTFMNREFT